MRVVVVGSSGMMGHMALRFLDPGGEVVGTQRSTEPDLRLSQVQAVERRVVTGLDVTDTKSLETLFREFRPEAVLNCVGVVKQLEEAREALVSIRINSLLPHELRELCDRFDAKLIHLSTDCVFSGSRGFYSLEDNPDPTDLYGRSKLLGEINDSSALTLRTSIIGRQLRGHTSLLDWFISQRGTSVRGFEQAIYSGLTTHALVQVIGQILREHPDLSGLWQIASNPISKFDLLGKINEAMNLGIKVIRDSEFRCDRSLDGSAFVQATGIQTPSWNDMVSELASDALTYGKIEA